MQSGSFLVLNVVNRGSCLQNLNKDELSINSADVQKETANTNLDNFDD